MKILFFANTDWYLYNFRLGLAQELSKQGIEVVLLSPSGDYGPRFAGLGFRWIALPMKRGNLNPFSEIALIYHIAKIYRREKPDLVHHFTIKCVIYGSIVGMCTRVRARVNAVTGLGYVFSNRSFLPTILRPLVKSLLRIVLSSDRSRLVLQNTDDRDVFIENGIAKNEFTRVIRGSGINTKKFHPVPGKKAGSAVKVLMAARLLWDKGLAEYIEAARILKKEFGSVKFLLAGVPDSGNPSSVSIANIANWVNEDIINYVGQIADMANFLESVDIVVLPSYREGVSRVLLEAAAAGLPCVTTDAPGCREVIEDKRNGFIVPIRDSKALADKIRLLINDPTLRERMGEKGREKVLQEFEETLVFSQTINVYKELVGPFSKT